MPDLSRVAAVLGIPYRTEQGQVVRATVRPPPPAGPGFEGAISPRFTLILPKGAMIPKVGTLSDEDGNRFLHTEWSVEGVLGQSTARMHILYRITGDEVWTRPVFTTEPISGQRVVSPTPIQLGTIPVVREFQRRKIDGGIEEEIYRVLCARDLQINDYLDIRRVTRVEKVRNLTYAEVF